MFDRIKFGKLIEQSSGDQLRKYLNKDNKYDMIIGIKHSSKRGLFLPLGTTGYDEDKKELNHDELNEYDNSKYQLFIREKNDEKTIILKQTIAGSNLVDHWNRKINVVITDSGLRTENDEEPRITFK